MTGPPDGRGRGALCMEVPGCSGRAGSGAQASWTGLRANPEHGKPRLRRPMAGPVAGQSRPSRGPVAGLSRVLRRPVSGQSWSRLGPVLVQSRAWSLAIARMSPVRRGRSPACRRSVAGLSRALCRSVAGLSLAHRGPVACPSLARRWPIAGPSLAFPCLIAGLSPARPHRGGAGQAVPRSCSAMAPEEVAAPVAASERTR